MSLAMSLQDICGRFHGGGWRARALLAGIVWLGAVATGLFIIQEYASTPGDIKLAPNAWPTGATVQHSPSRPTLVMFAHPQCPCTRASISELTILLSRFQSEVSTYILFVRPEGFDDEWMHSDLWQTASKIPGVTVASDDGGEEAARFGASTSGHVVLYDDIGHLLFSGGITKARGHAGDSDGRAALEAILLNKSNTRTTSFVFGCPLTNPTQSCCDENVP